MPVSVPEIINRLLRHILENENPEKELSIKMKEQILDTIAKLREQGVNFEETPPLFTWSYPEEPNIRIQLLITEFDQRDLPLEEPIH